MIKFSEWQYFKKFKHFDFIKPEFVLNDGELTVKLAGTEYVSAQFDSLTKDITPGKLYKINYELKTENEFARVIFKWYNDNDILEQGYLRKSGETILAPEGATILKISFRFNGFDKCEGTISEITAECLGDYQPKYVNLATVAIPHIYFPESQPPEYNLSETVKVIDRLCKKEKPDLIALTETFYTRKTFLPINEICKPVDCEAMNVIRNKAKEYNTFIALSFSEEENGHFYNSGILIDRKGEIVGKCHKCHLTMGEYENGLTPGREIKVFDTEIGKIGIAICWDVFFPEHIRQMQKQGVDIIVNPTAGYTEPRILQRAEESGAYIVTSVSASFDKSGIFSPEAKKLADASQNYGYACVTVDLNKPVNWPWLSYAGEGSPKNIYLNEARFDLYN